jgi:Ser/Thr protein kinase RdoA (MazF antagonist)
VPGYADLSEAEQVEVLRPVALAAAEQLGLDVVGLELVAHAYNTTFGVDTADGSRYALRVGTNSQSTWENVVAQQAWQAAIAAETHVLVATPVAASDGAWCARVESEAVGRSLLVTAASWLPGPDVVDIDVVVAPELGRTMALLHQQADGWAMPPGAEMPRFDTPLFGDRDLLSSAPGLSSADRAVLDRAMDVALDAFVASYDGAPVRPLHADLHGGNLKWYDGRLAVFDFDDCGLGVPALDLAISAFYLRGEDPSLEHALRAGYAQVAPVPEIEPAHFEAMVAARQLLLANSLLASTTAELRRDAERYLAVSVARLRHWLDTGTFTRAVSGSTLW